MRKLAYLTILFSFNTFAVNELYIAKHAWAFDFGQSYASATPNTEWTGGCVKIFQAYCTVNNQDLSNIKVPKNKFNRMAFCREFNQQRYYSSEKGTDVLTISEVANIMSGLKQSL